MSYLLKSKTSFYSFLFILPLFFLYEINILFLSWDDILVVRNGADFLMRNILESFDIYGLYGLGLVFFLGLLVTYIFFIKEDQQQEVNVNFLFIMLAESILWSVVLYFLLFKFMVLPCKRKEDPHEYACRLDVSKLYIHVNEKHRAYILMVLLSWTPRRLIFCYEYFPIFLLLKLVTHFPAQIRANKCLLFCIAQLRALLCHGAEAEENVRNTRCASRQGTGEKQQNRPPRMLRRS